jgi:tRNA-dihydrouridine synthase
VFNLAKEYPHLNFVINGGFDEVDKIVDIMKPDNPLLKGVPIEGVMSGRLAMNHPW